MSVDIRHVTLCLMLSHRNDNIRGDDGLGIGCPLLSVVGLHTEDNLPIGNRVEGGWVGEG
jgi:hypothetical protein